MLDSKVDKKRAVEHCVEFVAQHHQELTVFRSVEEFAIHTEEAGTKIQKSLERNLIQIRAHLARELWSREFFIGVSALDELLFYAFSTNATEPIITVLESIRRSRLHHPGMALFAVHSFGLLGAGFLHWASSARLDFISQKFEIAATPQTHSIDATIQFLNRAQESFGIASSVPSETIEHWFASRSLKWLTKNPLIAFKVHSFPGGMYENEHFLVSKLRLAAALLSMLSTLQPSTEDIDPGRLWSTRTTNNFQTLDIRHYITFFSSPRSRKVLDGDCVPLHLRVPAVAELSDLGIDLHPAYWTRRHAFADAIYEATRVVYSGYLSNRYGKKSDVRTRVCRKLFEALAYFRRSFLRTDKDWSAVISLAISFEMLLTDGYARNIRERIVRRSRILLKGLSGVRKLVAAIDGLYQARGALVHNGLTDLEVDLRLAQRAFVHIFVELSTRLPSLNETSQAPMKDLSGDVRQ